MVRVAAGLVLLATGCIIPIAAPSAKVEGGYMMSTATAARGTVRVGAHAVGNRLDGDAAWDLGAGYVGVAGTAADGMHDSVDASQGGYVEGSYLRRTSANTRVGIGPGVQMLFRQSPSGDAIEPVLYARAAFEVFSPVEASGAGDDKCGTAIGAWRGQAGIGTYVDVQRPMTDGGISVVAGVTLRLPAFAGVAVVIPGCK